MLLQRKSTERGIFYEHEQAQGGTDQMREQNNNKNKADNRRPQAGVYGSAESNGSSADEVPCVQDTDNAGIYQL